jgi:hypothetical protein
MAKQNPDLSKHAHSAVYPPNSTPFRFSKDKAPIESHWCMQDSGIIVMQVESSTE